jgi:UDPglucose 6-dehydrogenase
MNLIVVGAGYVGLVTAAGFAERGHDVLCVERDRTKIAALQRGDMPFYEPKLADLVQRNVHAHRLQFADSIHEVTVHADVVFIAVGTQDDNSDAPDVSAVVELAQQIARRASAFTVIAIKSTVPVGTVDNIETMLEPYRQRVAVASVPEFLKEGDAVNDFFRPSRIILGANDQRAVAVMHQLYASLDIGGDKVIAMNARSAEMTKYAANAMLATRVSFINEIAELSDALGANIAAVRIGIGSDPRIGPDYLQPGLGFGGSCLPKDLRALQHMAASNGRSTPVLDAVWQRNQRQLHMIADAILIACAHQQAPRVAIWGLAFKPNTDDVRQSPAVALMKLLHERGAEVRAHDPVVTSLPSTGVRVELHDDPYLAAKDADVLVLATAWPALVTPDFSRLRRDMRTHVAFDARNAWSPQAARDNGFQYTRIGGI